MPEDIQKIRAELNQLRDDIKALFDRIEQHSAANPDADPLSIPEQEENNVSLLRRRTAAAMGKVGRAVDESLGAPVTDTELQQFAEAVRQMRAALELKHDKASSDPPDVNFDGALKADQCQSISVAAARKVVKKAILSAKELLGLASGTSSHTPKSTEPTSELDPVTAPSIQTGGTSGGTGRQKADAFIQSVWVQEQVRIHRKHIWQAAKHTSARQFQYWQNGDAKATASDDENFNRILAMKPSDFVKQHASPKEVGF